MKWVYCPACDSLHSLGDSAPETSSNPNDCIGIVKPIHSGVKLDKYGQSCYAWALYLRKEVELILGMKVEEAEDLAWTLTNWSETYGGPGRWFSSSPSVKIGRNHILIKQFRGLDI